MKESKCICCGKDIETALKGEDVWDCPCDALRFTVDGTFGSSFYDMITESRGKRIQILICDSCLERNRENIREVVYKAEYFLEEIE